MRSIAVVGKHSAISTSLIHRLGQNKYNIKCSARRPDKDTVFLDLSRYDPRTHPFNEAPDTAFISAAMVVQRECEERPDEAWNINVEKTIALVEKFLSQGTHVIIPSTNLVLGCQHAFMDVNTPLAPSGVYGKTKAALETHFKDHPRVSIVRFTKILEKDRGIISIWKNAIKTCQPVNVVTNVNIAPISMNYAVRFLHTLIDRELAGIWHVSGKEDVCYKNLFDVVQQTFANPTHNYSNDQVNYFAQETAILYGSLNADNSTKELGLGYQLLDDVLADLS